ncbi:MAG: hypothetical protein EHM33_08540 [Chloroflexi bacterium]|nr:MAG: hypothetical protein EHM33_08540 [Chloroflexota bacterium]
MKKTGTTAIVIILSIVAIVVIVVSLLNTRPPAEVAPTPTSTGTATPILTPTLTHTPDPCAPENIEAAIIEFDKLSREFSDTFVLAQNTAAAQLSPVIIKMQEIRRHAEDFMVPACLSTLKEYQLGFMNTAIEASLLLYSSFSGDPNQSLTQAQVNDIVAQVNQRMAETSEYGNKYTAEMGNLLGVTLTAPPPTLEPEDLSTSTP